MELYADRLAKLAGLPAGSRQNLNEASNRSYHDGDNSDEADYRFGKNQLAEGEKDVDESNCAAHEADEKEEGMYREASLSFDPQEVREAEASEGHGHMMDEKHDDLIEIDEAMLAEEIARMRQERLQENELRSIIKQEVASVVKSLKRSREGKSENTTGSREGVVTRGFPGPGFR